MADPTPITKHRRYTKRQKASAVVTAMATSVKAAAEAHGVPRTTLMYWMESPEFDTLRQKTRDDLAKGFELLAHRSQGILMERLPEMEPRDITILLGVATEKAQLLTGAPTSRTETSTITGGLTDHERTKLRDAIDRWHERMGRAGSDDAAGSPGDGALRVGPEVRE